MFKTSKLDKASGTPGRIDRALGGLVHIANVGVMADPHRHVDLELNLVTAGTASYVLRGRRYELHRNTLVWLFPDQEHGLLKKSDRFDYWLGLFPSNFLNRFCTSDEVSILKKLDPPGNFCRILSDQSFVRLQNAFNNATSWSDSGTKEAALAYALHAAWEIFSSSDEQAGHSIHPSVDQALRMIRDEDEPHSLEVIAKSVGLSPQYLSELFKIQIGMTLSRFRNKQRIQRFIERDQASKQSMSVLDLALDVGFGSYPQFHRVFKELMGCTPSEYRRERV